MSAPSQVASVLLDRHAERDWGLPTQVEWEGRPAPPRLAARAHRFRRRLAEPAAPDAEMAMEAFLYHARLGWHYGYPECCVLQYAAEAPFAAPFQLRREVRHGCVPCDRCLDA